MINLKIKLTSSELSDFNTIIKNLFLKCRNTMNAEDYFHYYNLTSVIKKVFNKKFECENMNKNKISLSININEFESIKYVYFYEYKVITDTYFEIFMLNILGNMDKQVKNLRYSTNLIE